MVYGKRPVCMTIGETTQKRTQWIVKFCYIVIGPNKPEWRWKTEIHSWWEKKHWDKKQLIKFFGDCYPLPFLDDIMDDDLVIDSELTKLGINR